MCWTKTRMKCRRCHLHPRQSWAQPTTARRMQSPRPIGPTGAFDVTTSGERQTWPNGLLFIRSIQRTVVLLQTGRSTFDHHADPYKKPRLKTLAALPVSTPEIGDSVKENTVVIPPGGPRPLTKSFRCSARVTSFEGGEMAVTS
jgi:hypothetical protein